MEKRSEKELRRLSRRELLELLVEQGQELEQVREERDRLKTELENREIKIANAGSIAEAALSLSGIFEAAQKAADEYLTNVRQAAGVQTADVPELMHTEQMPKTELAAETSAVSAETTIISETTELGAGIAAAAEQVKAPVQAAEESRVQTAKAIYPAESAQQQKPQQRPVRQQPTYVQQSRLEKQEQARQEYSRQPAQQEYSRQPAQQENSRRPAQQKQAAYASAQFMEKQPTGPIDRRETAMPAQKRPAKRVSEADAFPIETYADGDGEGFDFLEI